MAHLREVVRKATGYRFKNVVLLERAFRNPPQKPETRKKSRTDNRQLAFAGDRIIPCLLALVILDRIEDCPVKEIKHIEDLLTKNEVHEKIGREHGLGVFRFRNHQKLDSKAERKTMAEIVEALVAAAFADGATLRKLKEMVVKLYGPTLASEIAQIEDRIRMKQ